MGQTIDREFNGSALGNLVVAVFVNAMPICKA